MLMLIGDLSQDLRQTLRTLAKYPLFTLIAVGTLALGIGANTSLFTLLDAVVFKPLPVPAAGDLVTFYENGPEGTADITGGSGRFLRFSYPRFARLERALGADGSMAAVTRSSVFVVRLPGSTTPHFLRGQLVSASYFPTLGISAARGRVIAADDLRTDRAPAAVVSDGLWKRLLEGSDSAVGRTIVVNDQQVTVVGVAPPGFIGMWTDSEADLWLPLTLQQALRYDNNSSSYGTVDAGRPWFEQDLVSWLNLVARVPHANRSRSVPRLQAANHDGVIELASTFANSKTREGLLRHTLIVEPFGRGFSGLRARFADALFVLAALVAAVLLVTCANLANLLLARAMGQARDFGVRISLGATSARLVRQCLVESLTLALAGGAAGLVLGVWTSRLLARQVLGTSGELPQVFSPDLRVLAFAATVSIVTALAFGLVPALRAIRAGRAAALGHNRQHGVGHAMPAAMRSLVVAQLALSVVVVFAALLFGRTLIAYLRIDPGFSTDRLVTVSFDPTTSGYRTDQLTALTHRLIAAVEAVPGVTTAAASRCGLIAGCSSSGGFRIEGPEPLERVTMFENCVTHGYFATVGIRMVGGRDFTERDADRAPLVAIVNEAIVRRYFAGQSPIGRRIGGDAALNIEIVGVVRDAHTQTLHEPAVPMVYFPIDQRSSDVHRPPTNLDVQVAGDPARAVSSIRDAIRRAEPDLLVSAVGPMSARIARDLTRERVVAWLAIGFGALTLLLASLGLYGVLSYSVARRMQELGVRVALGARPLDVMRLVLGQSARLTTLGTALGVLGAAAASQSLSRIVAGGPPLDVMTFAAVVATFALVTTAAAYMPARRATKVDPLVALRSE